jgi:hypothetical protein
MPAKAGIHFSFSIRWAPSAGAALEDSCRQKIYGKYPKYILTFSHIWFIDNATAHCAPTQNRSTRKIRPFMPGSITEIAAALAAERMGASQDGENPSARALEQALAELFNLMLHSESDATRLGATKALLERLVPPEDDEARRREAEERAASIAEARCLLAELAAAKFAGAGEPASLAEDRAAGTDNAAAEDLFAD